MVRVDFNVPLRGRRVGDDTRIRAAMPTIRYLSESGAIVILISYLGRPEGRVVEELRLAPVAKKLNHILEENMEEKPFLGQFFYLTRSIGPVVEAAVKKAKPGDIILLENIRFYREEIEANPHFALLLSRFGNIYVNEAFSVSHRNEASITGVPQMLPSYAGLEFLREIKYLGDLFKNIKHPFVLVLGGVKISDKIGVIRKLGSKADVVLTGGGVANIFLEAAGYKIGKSAAEENQLFRAKTLLEKFGDKIVLPRDVVLSDSTQADIPAKPKIFRAQRRQALLICKKGQAILDIGPKTAKSYIEKIKKAKTIVWSGPLGKFEEAGFSRGTAFVGEAIAEVGLTDAVAIAGGGDTDEAIKKFRMQGFDHVSMGGGAMLKFLEGDNFPGIEALRS